MEIYFSPEVINPHFQLLSIVDANGKAVGNVVFLFDEKKLYVHGLLEEKGVEADFKDLVIPYLKGMAKAKEGLDIFACLYSGCEKIDLNVDKESGNQ